MLNNGIFVLQFSIKQEHNSDYYCWILTLDEKSCTPFQRGATSE